MLGATDAVFRPIALDEGNTLKSLLLSVATLHNVRDPAWDQVLALLRERSGSYLNLA